MWYGIVSGRSILFNHGLSSRLPRDIWSVLPGYSAKALGHSNYPFQRRGGLLWQITFKLRTKYQKSGIGRPVSSRTLRMGPVAGRTCTSTSNSESVPLPTFAEVSYTLAYVYR
jgi:hypothetical protein